MIKTSNKGFTLIELLVVIAIIGMLSSVVFASLNGARVKSRSAKRISDLRQISTALELYYDTNGAYPVSTGGSGPWDGIYTCWGDSSGDSNPNGWIAGLAPTYIKSLPRDPRNHSNCGEQYIYYSNGVDYKLISHSPEECASVVARYPSLNDPTRVCWAYGFFTQGATNW